MNGFSHVDTLVIALYLYNDDDDNDDDDEDDEDDDDNDDDQEIHSFIKLSNHPTI